MRLENDDIYRIINGDEFAFERFMQYYSSRLYHYSLGLLGNKEAAEEIVSDVFFEVWKNRRQLAEINSMSAWLQTITYRKAISFLRKEIISKEEIQEINNAIEQLPAKCKHVFFLAKIEGLPYLEIADMLHISVKTINYHVAYAIDSIAKKLKKDFRKK